MAINTQHANFFRSSTLDSMIQTAVKINSGFCCADAQIESYQNEILIKHLDSSC